MHKDYNWKAILAGSVPVSIVMFFVFNSNIAKNLKWTYLVIGAIIAMGITYYMDKKKQNIFTSPFIIVIVALIVLALKNLGFI